MVKNKYKVPVRLWRKFRTDASKRLYNDIMDQMIPNQDLTTHPKTPKIPDGQWSTICHNAACYAVWAMDNDKLRPGDTVEEVNMKTGKTKRFVKAK